MCHFQNFDSGAVDNAKLKILFFKGQVAHHLKGILLTDDMIFWTKRLLGPFSPNKR